MKENLSVLLSLLAGLGIGINIIRLFIKRNVSKNEVENFFYNANSYMFNSYSYSKFYIKIKGVIFICGYKKKMEFIVGKRIF